MAEEQITTEIGMGELLSKVQTYYDAGYRLVQIGCTGLGDHYEINTPLTRILYLRTFG